MTISEFYEYMKVNNLFEVIVRMKYKYYFEEEYTYSNEYVCYNMENDMLEWENDWYEGQTDIEIIGYIEVDKIPFFKKLGKEKI